MAAGVTYVPLATTTLNSTSSSVSFTSISGSYTDLVLVIQAALSSSANDTWLRFNSDSGTNYSRTKIAADGSSVTTFQASNQNAYYGVGNINTSWMMSINHIFNYSNTTMNKSFITRHGSTGNETAAGVGLWRSTAAITSIEIAPGTSTFISGSTFTLYGIAAA